MNRIYVLATLLVFLSGCQTLGPNAARSGAFGGLAGGLAGAAIGATEGKAPEGGLIGAVAGATVGTVAGDAVDREVQQQRIAQREYQQQQIANSVNYEQIVKMTQSGLGSDVIARQIANQGIVKRPTIDDLIYLKNNGVDDSIIQALQTAPLAGQSTAAVAPPVPVVVEPTPVFVETYPRYRRRIYGPPPRHFRKCPPGVSFVVRFLIRVNSTRIS